MSSKFMYSLSDENPDLQKKIGCMNGLFQLFDCHHFHGSRRIAGPNHKSLPSGQKGKHGTKKAKIGSDKIKGNNLKKVVKEKQRLSFESSPTSSSSSSCSSNFSPTECIKESQVDQPSQSAFRETPRKEISGFLSDTSMVSSQNSIDLRNVVKGSIYREGRGISIKTAATKVEAGQHQTLKYLDSPRPLQSPKPSTTRNTVFNETSHAVLKFKEVPKMSNECEYGSLTFAPMDTHRFTYDGRGSKDAHKVKPKGVPRLSLDSRESSINGSVICMKSNFNRSRMNSYDMRNRQHEPESYKGPSGVVVKLMGIEALLDHMVADGNQCRQNKTGHDLKGDLLSPSLRVNENKRSLISGCSRNSVTEPRSPRMTNAESKKRVANRCSTEPAPWRQLDGNKGDLKFQETPMKATDSFQSVYGEIGKRLAELEFLKSGKELGACKRILETMQKSKQLSETRKGEQASSFISHTNSILRQSSEVSFAVSDTIKGTVSPTYLRSPIKNIKPENVMANATNSTSTVVAIGILSRLPTSNRADTINAKDDKRSYKDSTLRPNPPWVPSPRIHSRDKNTASTQGLHHISKDQSPTARENHKMAMSSETTCLKLHHKKLENEKQSRCTDPPSDQSRSGRQSSTLQAKSGLPRWREGHKPHNLRQSDGQLSNISSDRRDLSHQGDGSLMRSERNMSMTSYDDSEVTSAQSYGKIDGTFSPKPEKKQKNSATSFSEGNPKTEPPITALEPSPVSVLDATFYGDDSPSPVKKKSNAFEGDEGLTANDADWSSIGLNHLLTCRETSPRLMNSDSINEIEHICNSPNPDHEYIAEVMSASGLLGEQLDFSFMAYQLHPSGHLINPNLFASLEQFKAGIWFLNRKHNLDTIEKNHKQLIFDAVNEILIMKSVKKGSYKQWILPSVPENRRRKRLQMVRDLCSEIDILQATSNIEDDNNLNSMLCRDLMVESMDWTECRREIPWLVLDVEKFIFKDLICEVISSQAANVQQQQRRRHCRRLFSM